MTVEGEGEGELVHERLVPRAQRDSRCATLARQEARLAPRMRLSVRLGVRLGVRLSVRRPRQLLTRARRRRRAQRKQRAHAVELSQLAGEREEGVAPEHVVPAHLVERQTLERRRGHALAHALELGRVELRKLQVRRWQVRTVIHCLQRNVTKNGVDWFVGSDRLRGDPPPQIPQ